MQRLSLLVVSCVLATLAACDTGDGTEMQPPSEPTTLPPPDTTPLSSVVIDPTLPAADPGVDGDTPGGSGNGTDAPAGVARVFAPWADGGTIDPRYGCDGSNVSPPLSWSDLPDNTVELAVSLVDESNLSNGQPFVHWVMGGITVDGPSGSLDEGEMPLGAVLALNFFGDVAYTGPCPNPGESNDYRLTVYALPQQLEIADGAPATEFLDAITTLSTTTASVTGTSSR